MLGHGMHWLICTSIPVIYQLLQYTRSNMAGVSHFLVIFIQGWLACCLNKKNQHKSLHLYFVALEFQYDWHCKLFLCLLLLFPAWIEGICEISFILSILFLFWNKYNCNFISEISHLARWFDGLQNQLAIQHDRRSPHRVVTFM